MLPNRQAEKIHNAGENTVSIPSAAPTTNLSDTQYITISNHDQPNLGVSTIRWFKYVRHEDRAAYERDGWIFAAELGPTHGYYSVLMEKIENTDDHTEKERHGAANTRPDARDTPSG